MRMMGKITASIILTISSTGLAYSAPCYTNTGDGCGNNSNTIYVKTEDTSFGSCTEYLNEKKQKVVRCHSSPPEADEPVVVQTATRRVQQPNTYNFNYNVASPPSNQTNNYNNSSSGFYGYGYWNNYHPGYYNNGYYYGNSGRPGHRPPHRPNRPHGSQAVTLPSTPMKGNNNQMRPSTPPNNNHRPSPPNHRPPSGGGGYHGGGGGSHGSGGGGGGRATLPSTRF